MAQTKKNSKTKKDYENVADFLATFSTKSGAIVQLSLYDNGSENRDGVKLLIADTFVIYGTAVIVNKKKDRYAFLSYPSYYSKKKEEYVNMAFSIDSDLNAEINDALTKYYFE